jgi:hypothetical protein
VKVFVDPLSGRNINEMNFGLKSLASRALCLQLKEQRKFRMLAVGAPGFKAREPRSAH